MSIEIDDGGGGSKSYPYISLREVGQDAVFAVIKAELADTYVYGSDPPELKLKKDGTPKKKVVLTVLVIGGSGVAPGEEKGTFRPLVPGEICTVHIEGQAKWDPDLDKLRPKGAPKSWSSAKDDHGGKVLVGDVVRWHFDSEVPGKGANPRRLRLFKMRHPKPEEAAQTARCEQLHHELKGIVAVAATAPASGPFGNPFGDDVDF